MRVFKNKWFARFAKKSGIADNALCQAIMEAQCGLIHADLGGGIIKQRVAKNNKGKSGGFRTLIVFKMETRAVFVYGFAKNEIENIDNASLTALKLLAEEILNYDESELTDAIHRNALIEVICNEKTIS